MTFKIGTPHIHNAGYYRNDDTCSGGKLSQADVQTCPHCQSILKMQEWKEDGGFCRRCDAPICALCAQRALTYGCEPFLRTIETHANALVKYEQYLKIAGLDAPAPPQSPIYTG